VKIVVDTYAWIEMFIGSKKGEKAKEIVEKADEAYTPDIVTAEIARKYLREGISEQTILERLKTTEDITGITPINKNTAIESAKCYLELLEKAKTKRLKAPSLFDAVILATARTLNAKLITGDEHLKDFNETLWIGNPQRNKEGASNHA
jgi:predicted nucleic acid-binding protein